MTDRDGLAVRPGGPFDELSVTDFLVIRRCVVLGDLLSGTCCSGMGT